MSDKDTASEEAANAIQKTQYAQQHAVEQANRPTTEDGVGLEDSPTQVENKMRSGAEGTEAALHILGAGQPYQPGSY